MSDALTPPKAAPFGSWRSPITSDLIVAKSIGLMDVWLADDSIYWCERRPQESGRFVVVRKTHASGPEDLTPAPFNARSRVHEYGGGAVLIHGSDLYFSNYSDHKLHRQAADGVPAPISHGDHFRFADFTADAARHRLICIREDHSTRGAPPQNTITAVRMDGSGEADEVLVHGNDFYANPRLSPDGTRLAWLTWNHPHMPWMSCELWTGEVDGSGHVVHARRVAGSETESICQPEWSPAGVLHFVSDRSGWWNLYREQDGEIVAIHPKQAEFGNPHWNFGLSSYAFLGDGRLVCTYKVNGISQIDVIEAGGSARTIATGYTDVSQLRACGGQIAFIGGTPRDPSAVVRVTVGPDTAEVLKQSSAVAEVPEIRECLTKPRLIEFPTARALTAFAWYYPPHNPRYRADESAERPPLIVKSHGGPTASASSSFSLQIQYWTSRGFAVVDVDYGGSSGYGRDYRERLHRTWGIVDVEDCTNAALFLAKEGLADENRMAITGGSAGGFTTLAALVFGKDFKVGASYYGVGDLMALARDTHKFEARYLDWLVGDPVTDAQVYHDRSPINFADRLSVPVILLQGEDDKIVPPNQAEQFANAVRKRDLPLGYFLFEGEGHGFVNGENIKRALDAELYFYSSVLVRNGLRF